MDLLPKNKLTDKQLWLLLYKLFNDALFLWAIVFAVFLVAESLLPGFLTSHISFTKLILAFFAIMIFLSYAGWRNNLFLEDGSWKSVFKNKTAYFLAVLGIALMINSLRSIGRFNIAIVAIVSIFIIYYFFQILFAPDE